VRHEDIGAFFFIALWSVIVLGAAMFLAGH
jgi:hypothetical protein